jgi:NAD(P)-dependent dehydrogenase (short-subunit alcohol dehydrogenase family)
MRSDQGQRATADRTAVVTGGASGIGRALAEELARLGTHVVLADRQIELAHQVAAGIRERGGSATAQELDVRDAGAFRGVVERTAAACGRLDYLFNNAGIVVAGRTHGFEAADWDEVIDVNLRGVAHGILAAYPLMIRQGFGHIVNTASMWGLYMFPLQISYTATKHAVVGLSRALRIEARPFGVKVSVLCPGPIATPILEGGRFGRFKPDLDTRVMRRALERLRPMDPAPLACRVIRAVQRNRAIIVEPGWWRLLWYLDRASPWLSEKFCSALSRRLERRLRAAQAGRPG